jgi:hypothetical protein
MTHRLLIDNDALLKLARYGLLDAAVKIFGVSYLDIQILATAKYSLLPAKNRLLRCKDEDSANRLEEFLTNSLPLDIANTDPSQLDALSAVPGIDAGEALLLATAASDPQTFVITGDKRALVSLCTDSSISNVANALAGRVVTLEWVLWRLVKNDFGHTQACVRSKPDVDKALSHAFGVVAPATMDSVYEALASYIKHLQSMTGSLLPSLPN